MTNAETIGRSVPEQKRREQELRALHLKAGQHAAKFAMLAQLLRDDPGAIVFDEQSTSRRSDTMGQLESTEFSGRFAPGPRRTPTSWNKVSSRTMQCRRSSLP
jgi:hypothetical protein